MLYLPALIGSTAFTAPTAPIVQQVVRSSAPSMAMSKSLPFLTAPKCQSSGMLGAEAGFDPLYLSDFFDIKWMREAELKHGRICMLASAGYITQELYGIPGYPGYNPNGIEAFSSVPSEALFQIFALMAWFEFKYNDSYTMMGMFEDPKKIPGNVGFDPLKFGENKATREKLEMQELTHGRLAMLAFSGMVHQTFVTGKPVLASLGDIFAAP